MKENLNNKIISLKNVSFSNVLKNINFEIKTGEIIAIMGNSGSGKTTLLNLLSGFIIADQGELIVLNQNLKKMKNNKLDTFRRENITYIFQDYKLVNYLNVKENISLIQKLNHQKIDKEKFNSLVNELGLDKLINKPVTQLSGGQKQRVAIGRSLIGLQPLVFADEPTGALDLPNRNLVMNELITNAQRYQKTLIVITHDFEVALKAQKIIFIKNHQIDAIWKTNEVNQSQVRKKLEE